MDNCRIYVCKSYFGQKDECKRFEDMYEYKTWLMTSEHVGYTSFQPVCNVKEIFDRLILSLRSGKIVDIKNI